MSAPLPYALRARSSVAFEAIASHPCALIVVDPAHWSDSDSAAKP